MKKFFLAMMLTTIVTVPLFAQNGRTYSRSSVDKGADSTMLWPVSGAANMGFKHVISYGDFTTSRAHATIGESSTTVIIPVSYQKRLKINFKQRLGDMEVKVKVRQNQNLDDLARVAKILGNHNNLDKGLDYTATVNDPVEGVWTMAMNTSFSDEDFDCGFVYCDNNDTQYTIRGRNYSNSRDVMLMRANFYYNIYDGDKVIASVDSEGKGWAWIDTTLAPERQIVLAAAVSSMLMLKWNLN